MRVARRAGRIEAKIEMVRMVISQIRTAVFWQSSAKWAWAKADGRKIYSLADIYPHADFVTYPSLIEGFGNAFLEAIYFRKPLLMQRYDGYG
jgi:hypothetical protein